MTEPGPRRTAWLGVAGGVLVALMSAALAGPESLEAPQSPQSPDATATRAVEGLLALYDFGVADGDRVVPDRSGVGEPLDLEIDRPERTRRRDNRLFIRKPVTITSREPARKINDAVRSSGSLTVEAWIRPRDDRQSGPARIVTLSADTVRRNVTLGQDGERWDLRLRTTSTSANGLPSTATGKSVRTVLSHVVATRDASGNAQIWVDGRRVASKKVRGELTAWDRSFRLCLANEVGGDRPWLGELHLVAIYGRALSAAEIRRNHAAGASADSPPPGLARAAPQHHFDARIAPILARHCLECHDSEEKKGGLDLSRKDAALAGGRSGKAIVPGNLEESLLWEEVEADEMPKKRTPLSPREKKLLREWIENGAPWTTEVIDRSAVALELPAEWVRRLTVPEYIATVRATLGVDVADEAREILPPDLRADGFSNTAYNLNVDLRHVEAYARLAEIIVERMDALEFAARFTKSRKLTDDNMREFIAKMGKWVFRGPLDGHEIDTLRGISTTVASAGGDFEEATRFILEAMLQSPRFIYRLEDQRGDGSLRLPGDHELAARISYIIWGGPPDRELARAADEGELTDPETVRAHVERMLADPRGVERSLQFASEWLDLGRLENLRPDPERFPAWDDELAADMRRETLAFFEDLVWKQKRPLSELLNAQFTRATPRLARHYGLDPERGEAVEGSELARYDLSEVPSRGGLLTHGSVLTIGGDDASMVTRGLFVLHDILAGEVEDPPPGVDTTPVPAKEGLSRRDVSEQRLANPSCGGCHARFEPFAFGFEKYDGLGAHHEKDEHGNQQREDGEILFPGAEKAVPYRTTGELMNLLATSEPVRENVARKLTQFALGRPLIEADGPALEKILAEARKGGDDYGSLITAIVLSDLVQWTRTESD